MYDTDIKNAGKYAIPLQKALDHCGAELGILIVLDGKHGPGFSASVNKLVHENMPDLLRNLADNIEKKSKDFDFENS